MVNRLQIEKELENKRKDMDKTFYELNDMIRINVRKKTKTAQTIASAIAIASMIAGAVFALRVFILKAD